MLMDWPVSMSRNPYNCSNFLERTVSVSGHGRLTAEAFFVTVPALLKVPVLRKIFFDIHRLSDMLAGKVLLFSQWTESILYVLKSEASLRATT